jgi:hypothetical protein
MPRSKYEVAKAAEARFSERRQFRDESKFNLREFKEHLDFTLRAHGLDRAFVPQVFSRKVAAPRAHGSGASSTGQSGHNRQFLG